MPDNKAIHKFKNGDIFDERYTLIKLIGVGGFADVWSATDNSTGATVALKIYTNLDEDGINDLAKEYTQMQGLNHTNILKAEHFDRWGNIPYLVMKLCSGGSLDKKIGKLDAPQILKVISDMANGLAYLHANGIVHQDIKPANILIDDKTEEPIYVLSDFGISSKTKTRLSHSVNLKNQGTNMTEAYAPPEKFSPKKADRRPDRKGDIFSFGISIYELATGGMPFDELSTGRQLLYDDAQVDFSEIEDDRIRRIAELCMQPDKEARPTAQEVAGMVTSADLPKGPSSSGSGSGRYGGGGGAASRHTVRVQDAPSKWKRLWPLLLFLVAVAGVVFFFVFDIFKTSDSGAPAKNAAVATADTFKINGVELIMAKLPAGDFMLGASALLDSAASADDEPTKRHIKEFSMSLTEVTQGLWNALMDSNPSTVKGDDYPVNNVSWEDCQIFIQRLNAVTGETFRLPTEAEWEYAAKLSKGTDGKVLTDKYSYSGSDKAEQVAWYASNAGGKIHPVGKKKANDFGLHDMSGNVIEWCSDIYSSYSTGSPIMGSAQRVLRGGYYEGDEESLRNTTRGSCDKDTPMEFFGFRLAK